MKDSNDKELSPCIVAWGRYALQSYPKNTKPRNDKTCSYAYWVKVIDALIDTGFYNKDYRQIALDEFKKVKHKKKGN